VISFRYLVVTIVSIFLALGLGVLAGTTVVDQGLVKDLRNRTHSAERAERQLRNQVKNTNSFIQLALPYLVKKRLAHEDVIIVSDNNTDGGAVGEARTMLSEAGAKIVADVTITSRLDPSNPSSSGLRQVLTAAGAPAGDDVARAAAAGLAARLQEPGPAVGATTGRGRAGDLLGQLLNSGYLVPNGSAPNLADVGGPGQVAVVVAGGSSSPAVPYDAFLVPFVEQLVRDGIQVAAAEPVKTAQSFVGLIRSDSLIATGSPIVTVDDLSAPASFGGVALVLGLRELLRVHQGGNYGVKSGASGLIPQVP
jgi:hypothetical protein